MTDHDIAAGKARAAAWFKDLRNRIRVAFETLEDEVCGARADQAPGRFEETSWRRPEAAAPDSDDGDGDGGGGVMSVMRGRVFEKVGVNISTVHGVFSEPFRAQFPGAADDGRFWACGVSLVAHMHSPLVPAAHMNTRHIVTRKWWFGGGADLTPTFPDQADTAAFHSALKAACDDADPDYYARYRKWCDEYFFLKHRNEPRGVGGIFYDQLNSGDWDADFQFTRGVGEAFLDVYPRIVRRHMNDAWSDAQRQALLVKRGRYVEFNLLYDRGARFGLMTDGDPDAVLMSMPPEARWP